MGQDRERLKHLLIILLEAMSAHSDSPAARRLRVQDKVLRAGLDEEDVNDLLDWIESQWDLQDLPRVARSLLPEPPSADSVRVFGDFESEMLTPAALEYLVKLQQSGQIDRAELEGLLHYASLMGLAPLEAADLETVIEQVLFRPGRPGMTGGASEGHNDMH